MKHLLKIGARLLLCVGSGLTVALAVPAAYGEKKKNSGDLWKNLESDDWPVLYESKKGPIEEFRLLGRFDLQYGALDSDRGDVDDFEVRRLRVGTRIKFFDNWRIRAVANLNDGNRVSYRSINSAYIGYYPSKHFKFKFGKQTAHYSQEWSTGSSDLRVIERSLLVQQLRPRRTTGLSMNGDWKQWDYEVGVYSGERDDEFGSFDAGFYYQASLGYDFTDLFDSWKDFDLRLSYLHNDGDRRNDGPEPYRDSYSLALNLRKKRFRLTADALYADGIEGRADVWGFLVTPSYELIDDKLEIVFRYHFAKSNGRDGVRLQGRLDREAPDLIDRGRGDKYQSIYLGLKHHILEDRLTFSAGIEYADLEDRFDDGGEITSLTGLGVLRFHF